MTRAASGPVLDEPAPAGEWACRVLVKAVPGASRSGVAGVLGERLKIRVAAPPEAGRANAELARVLAAALGVTARQVELASGPARAEKAFIVRGIDAARARAILALPPIAPAGPAPKAATPPRGLSPPGDPGRDSRQRPAEHHRRRGPA